MRRCERKRDDPRDEEDGRKPVGLKVIPDSGQDEVRVVPETPEKDCPSESEGESHEEPASPVSDESQATYLEAEESRSPVFKGGRPQKRREPVGLKQTKDMFDSEDEEEESQSIISMAKRNRKQI